MISHTGAILAAQAAALAPLECGQLSAGGRCAQLFPPALLGDEAGRIRSEVQ
jgi:hypothetical protein